MRITPQWRLLSLGQILEFPSTYDVQAVACDEGYHTLHQVLIERLLKGEPCYWISYK